MSALPEPPHDLAAEQAAVGAAIQSAGALRSVLERVDPADFYRPIHGDIVRAACRLDATGEPVDPVTVAAALGGDLGRIGGAPYLLTLVQSVPVTQNAGYYAEIVAEKATRRALTEAATRATQRAHADHRDAADVVEACRAELDGIAQRTRPDVDLRSGSDLADAALRRYAEPVAPSVPTGWVDIDHALNGGLRPGTLTVIAARPAIGKSMIGLNLPVHVARSTGAALVVSLEMTEAELTDRIIASLGGVELDRLTQCRLSPDDWRNVEMAAAELREVPLRIVDNPHMTLTRIASLARDCQRSIGLRLLVVDYLTLVTPADPRLPRQEQVAGISRGLKLMAKTLGVPIVALAQVNRGPEGRADKRPGLADLRESGAIEADSDAVWFLHYDDRTPYLLEVNISKNRHGRRAQVSLAWSPSHARAANLSRLGEEEAG